MDNLRFDKDTYICLLEVTNIGSVDGIETVQVYFRDDVSSVMTPRKQLIAFRRIALKAGEMQTVCIQLKRDDFSLVNADGCRVVEAGSFTLMAGSSSRDPNQLTINFQLQ